MTLRPLALGGLNGNQKTERNPFCGERKELRAGASHPKDCDQVGKTGRGELVQSGMGTVLGLEEGKGLEIGR